MTNLFGTSGVRGVINEKITPKLGTKLGKSFGTLIGKNKILIGRDSRNSGKMLEKSINAGLLSTGCKITKLRIIPTPVLAFATKKSQFKGGIMITASHNPAKYNGMKFFNSTGISLSQQKEKKLEKIYKNKNYRKTSWNKIKNISSTKFFEKYFKEIKKITKLEKNHEVLVDCGNGPTSLTTPIILRRLGCTVKTINSNLDGKFPGRNPEPKPNNLKDLSNLVKKTNANIGFAHDGDGDRTTVIDDKGRFVNQDILIGLLGKYYAKKGEKNIITTVGASKTVEDLVQKAGGKVTRTKIGDTHITHKMKKKNSKFGAEPSGTWIFGNFQHCPDGTFATIKILEMLEKTDEKLSELINSIKKYPIKRINLPCKKTEKKQIMKKAKEKIHKIYNSKIKNITKIDGLRIELEDNSWILIRPSGTEPLIRITVESKTEKNTEKIIKKTKKSLKN